MPSGDTLSVILFLFGVAATFFVPTLRPEDRRVRIMLRIVAVSLVLVAFVWPFLGAVFPRFALSGFATALAGFASSPLTWFILLMVSLIGSSLIPAVERWQANRLPVPLVTTVPPPLIETYTEGSDVSLSLSQALAASSIVDTKRVPSAVVFVVEESWISYVSGENFPLKLWVRWANEGTDISLGKPRWAANTIDYQGQRTGQRLTCRFKHRLGEASVESSSMTALCGQRGEIWVGLDPSFDVEQVRRWKAAKQLGLLVLPVTVGVATKMEIQIQL